MEDKKVMQFIQENHKKEYAKWVKQQKKKARRDNILILTGILAVLTVVLWLGSVIHQETINQVNKCLKSGESEAVCLWKAQ